MLCSVRVTYYVVCDILCCVWHTMLCVTYYFACDILFCVWHTMLRVTYHVACDIPCCVWHTMFALTARGISRKFEPQIWADKRPVVRCSLSLIRTRKITLNSINCRVSSQKYLYNYQMRKRLYILTIGKISHNPLTHNLLFTRGN